MTAPIDTGSLASDLYRSALTIQNRKVQAMMAGADTLTGHFSICPLNDITPGLQWPENLQPAYEALNAIHCVNWADMDDIMRHNVKQLVGVVVDQLLGERAEYWGLHVMGG